MPHPAAQDIVERGLLISGQQLDSILGDHASVRHDGDTADVKTAAQRRDDFLHGLLVCGIAGVNLPGDGPTGGIHGYTQHPLGQVRPMIPGVAPLAPVGFGIPIHIQAGRIDEDDVQGLVKQVQISAEEFAFQIFPHLSQKSGGAIEVLQGQFLEPRRFDGLDPGRASQIRAGSAQPLQGHGESSPFQREFKFALPRQGFEEFRKSLFFPQPTKYQSWSPLLGRSGSQTRSSDRLYHSQIVTEFAQTSEQAVQVPRSCQLISPPQSGDYLLADFTLSPVRPNDLQVFIGVATSVTTFSANKHDNNIPLNIDNCQDLSGVSLI